MEMKMNPLSQTEMVAVWRYSDGYYHRQGGENTRGPICNKTSSLADADKFDADPQYRTDRDKDGGWVLVEVTYTVKGAANGPQTETE